jgi:hypothetical protein
MLGVTSGFLEQAGLADPRFAGHDHHAGMAA